MKGVMVAPKVGVGAQTVEGQKDGRPRMVAGRMMMEEVEDGGGCPGGLGKVESQKGVGGAKRVVEERGEVQKSGGGEKQRRGKSGRKGGGKERKRREG